MASNPMKESTHNFAMGYFRSFNEGATHVAVYYDENAVLAINGEVCYGKDDIITELIDLNAEVSLDNLKSIYMDVAACVNCVLVDVWGTLKIHDRDVEQKFNQVFLVVKEAEVGGHKINFRIVNSILNIQEP